ncbi:MAG: ATP-binding protein, partial [Burkholderiales bacterium]|nr:ATP-binding protein [Burkholderiales bacterium]
LSGIDSNDAAGRKLWDLVLSGENAADAKRRFAQTVAGEGIGRKELEWRHRDGSSHCLEWRSARFVGPDGVPYVISSGLDVTEQRSAEQHARARLDELAGLYRIHTANELAATLAHELNQPLAAIASLSEGARAAFAGGRGDPAALDAALGDIRDQALRAGRFINELRRFVAQGEMKRSALDLNALVRSACTLAGPLAARHGVNLLLGLGAGLEKVVAAEIQIEHVVTNLVRNAVEAISHAGLRAGQVRVTTHADDDGMACVSVVDTGPGISSERLAHLFEPFFTTKPDGLGMGLRVSRTIVEAHGGRLWAESAPGGVLRFTLPFAR